MTGQLSQAPESAQNGSFLVKDSATRIVIVGTASVTRDASTAQGLVQIVHNLGYAPAFMAFLSTSSLKQTVPVFSYTAAGDIMSQFNVSVDLTTIYLTVSRQSVDPSYGIAETQTFKYYLFAEEAT